jgi:PhzF family phenazine biosynthesis protein
MPLKNLFKRMRASDERLTMSPPVYLIDTFTSTPFKGNPTAVCIVPAGFQPASMQDLALELKLPVTAFIIKQDGYGYNYNIRYFTVTTEIPACGHATLASAKLAMMHDASTAVSFRTANGLILETVSEGDVIMMNYPRYEMQSYRPGQATLESLGLTTYITAGFSPELETLFIETGPQLLRSLQPDYPRLVQSNMDIKEVVIMSVADDSKYDYLLRSFCPWIGIDEDPVTGSVHSVMAGYWKDKLGKSVLRAYQASDRGGELVVEYHHDKVRIGGACVVSSESPASSTVTQTH